MPVQFTCRLTAARGPGGNYLVQYAPLGGGDRVIVVAGPRVLVPPVAEMSGEDLARWERDALPRLGYTVLPSTGEAGTVLVEVQTSPGDEIPAGVIGRELRWAEKWPGLQTVAVDVTNGWDRPISGATVEAVCPGETPADGDGAPVFHRADGMPSRDLSNGLTARFVLDPRFLRRLRDRAATLPPDGHWISLRSGGSEFARIPGADVAAFLARGRA